MKIDRDIITPNFLRKILRLDGDTGRLYWLTRTEETHKNKEGRDHFNARHAGKEALASRTNHGYLRGAIMGQYFSAHRVAWAIHYGEWPQYQIDHINGNASDNRISNLRDVTCGENCRNRRRILTNTTGVMGVYWSDKYQKWGAKITVDYKYSDLGLFDSKQDAICARKKAEKDNGFHPNHGRATPKTQKTV